MTSRIRTYEDLLAEKTRLQSLLAYNQELIKSDIVAIKQELTPLKAVMGFLSKFTSKSGNNPLINVGVDLVGDVLLKNFLFAKSGLITKTIVPFLLKNLSSNLLTNSNGHIVEQIAEKIAQFTNLFKGKKSEKQVNSHYEKRNQL